MHVQPDKQQYLYGALSSAPSTAAAAATTTTSQLSVNSHNDKPTTTKAQLTTASRDDAESLTWRQRQDPVEAMSRITVGASQSKSSSSSSSQLRHDSSVDRCKYGVETNDLSALEHVRITCVHCRPSKRAIILLSITLTIFKINFNNFCTAVTRNEFVTNVFICLFIILPASY